MIVRHDHIPTTPPRGKWFTLSYFAAPFGLQTATDPRRFFTVDAAEAAAKRIDYRLTPWIGIGETAHADLNVLG